MRQLPREIQEIYPFKSRWMDIDGHRIHYVDEGQGAEGSEVEGNGHGPVPTVVLLHGNPTWSFIYREIIPLISDHCRVIAPDYLGMGLSDKPEDEHLYTLENHTAILTEFITRLKLKNFILVVQDWGGPIGFGYVMHNVENIAGMLIMNTWAWPEPSQFHASILPWRMMHAPVVGAHLFLRCNILIERGLYLSTGRRDKFKQRRIKTGYQLPFSLPTERVAMLAFPRNIPLKPGDLNWDRMAAIRDALPSFSFPCRLLWGEKDIVFPLGNAHLFQELLPNCSDPRVITHGMHFIQEDAPEEIAREIHGLLNETHGARRG